MDLDQQISQLIDQHKAENIVSLSLKGKTSIADTMIIATGQSQKHIEALADYAYELLRKEGIKNIKIEGLNNSEWVLLDAHTIIIHFFTAEKRSFYNLEKLWADLPA